MAEKKKFRVIAQMITNCEIIVEAESEEEAMEIGRGEDAAIFKEIENSGSWNIDSAFEVESDEIAVNAEEA